ncbi:MAG: ZIP family metal transporter [Patescibacteria group bacterium]|jgi:zinc and cadmium transporter
MVLAYTIVSVVIVSLISFVGAITLFIKEEALKKLLLFFVAFSTGALIGDAFLHLLPETVERTGSLTLLNSISILSGILFFFALEKFLHWRHCHDIECEEHPRYLGVLNLVGDGFHNFIDGILIGASFLVSMPLGITTTVAVALHEIPQELGDFGILLHSGFNRGRAIFYNLISGSIAIAGGVIAYFIGQDAEAFVAFVVPLTIGGFIYIALSGLVPELHKEERWQLSLWQFISMILGIGVMGLLLFLD